MIEVGNGITIVFEYVILKCNHQCHDSNTNFDISQSNCVENRSIPTCKHFQIQIMLFLCILIGSKVLTNRSA